MDPNQPAPTPPVDPNQPPQPEQMPAAPQPPVPNPNVGPAEPVASAEQPITPAPAHVQTPAEVAAPQPTPADVSVPNPAAAVPPAAGPAGQPAAAGAPASMPQPGAPQQPAQPDQPMQMGGSGKPKSKLIMIIVVVVVLLAGAGTSLMLLLGGGGGWTQAEGTGDFEGYVVEYPNDYFIDPDSESSDDSMAYLSNEIFVEGCTEEDDDAGGARRRVGIVSATADAGVTSAQEYVDELKGLFAFLGASEDDITVDEVDGLGFVVTYVSGQETVECGGEDIDAQAAFVFVIAQAKDDKVFSTAVLTGYNADTDPDGSVEQEIAQEMMERFRDNNPDLFE